MVLCQICANTWRRQRHDNDFRYVLHELCNLLHFFTNRQFPNRDGHLDVCHLSFYFCVFCNQLIQNHGNHQDAATSILLGARKSTRNRCCDERTRVENENVQESVYACASFLSELIDNRRCSPICYHGLWVQSIS